VIRCGLDASGSGYGPVAGSGEHSDEPSGFHNRQGIYRLAKEDSAPWN
jgi:hypothetical protein